MGSPVDSESSCVTAHDLIRQVPSLPPADSFEWKKAVFRLARVLQGAGVARAADARGLVKAWHAAVAVPESTFGEVWGELLVCWPLVKVPHGLTAAEIAMLPDDEPLPQEAEPFADAPLYVRLIRICRNFHRQSRGGRWFLSCRDAGRWLGVSHVRANRMLRALEAAGILHCEKTGSLRKVRGTESNEASEWSYVATENARPA